MKDVIIENQNNVVISPAEDCRYIHVIESDHDSEFSLDLNFDKENVTCEILVLGNLRNKTNVKINTLANHLVPNTSCTTNYFLALNDSSSSEYLGKIKIAVRASNTSSFLNNKTLVLGSSVKNTARPILEIEANDVKASHASATGRAREEDIFYLMSRGLSRTEAISTIAQGFFESLLDRISNLEVREKVRNKLKS